MSRYTIPMLTYSGYYGLFVSVVQVHWDGIKIVVINAGIFVFHTTVAGTVIVLNVRIPNVKPG